MNRFSRLILACAVAIMILPGNSYAQMAFYPINVDKISDPDIKTAVEMIKQRHATIKEIVIEDQKTMFMVGGKVTNSAQAKIYRRAPDLLLKQAKFQSGDVIGELFDGKFYYELNFAPPLQLKQIEAEMKAKNASQADIDKAVAQKKAAYSKVDLAKLKTAGVLGEFFFLTQFAVCPLAIANPETLGIIADTTTEWVFTAKTRKNPRITQEMGMEFMIEKKNCQCLGFKLTAGGDQVTITNDKISVDPAKKIEDKTFQYQPPAGVTFTDITDKTIAEFKAGK